METLLVIQKTQKKKYICTSRGYYMGFTKYSPFNYRWGCLLQHFWTTSQRCYHTVGWASVLRSSCWQWPNYGLGRESDWSKKLGNGFVRWSVYPQARPAISILMRKEWKGRRYFWLRIITIGKQAFVIFSLKTVYSVATVPGKPGNSGKKGFLKISPGKPWKQ